MALNLEGLTVERIVVHTIPKRSPGKMPGVPIYAPRLTNLAQAGKDVFQLRITESLGKRSHGIELSIVDFSPQSFMQIGSQLMYANDASFLSSSQAFANQLVRIQANLDLAASKLIVISGRIGLAQHRYVAVIKADLQDGFADDNVNGTTLLENLFLTPTQRLFKIGLLEEAIAEPVNDEGMRNEENFRVHLFDHLVTTYETRNAAHYFYSQFLGSDMLHSQKKITRDFFELSSKFINSSPVSQDRKFELLDALRTELRSNRATVHSETFAADNLDAVIQQGYLDFLAQNDFQAGAFSKDIEYIKGRLKKRQRIKFSHGVEISAPADSLHSLVTIQESNAQRTVLVINASIESQE